MYCPQPLFAYVNFGTAFAALLSTMKNTKVPALGKLRVQLMGWAISMRYTWAPSNSSDTG